MARKPAVRRKLAGGKRKRQAATSSQVTCHRWPALLAKVVAAHADDPNLLQPITLVYGDPPVERHAHALTVLGFSEPLRSMLSGGGVESATRRLELPEVSAECCEQILSYVHTGTVTFDDGSLFELLKASDLYAIAGLTQLLEEVVADRLSPDRALSVLAMALSLRSVPTLQGRCEDYIDVHASDVLKDVSFAAAAEEMAALVIQRESLALNSELRVFEAVLRWQQEHNDQAALARLLALVRFPTMRSHELDQVKLCPFMKQGAGMLLLWEACRFGANQPPPEHAVDGSQEAMRQRRRFITAPITTLGPHDVALRHGIVWALATAHGRQLWAHPEKCGLIEVHEHPAESNRRSHVYKLGHPVLNPSGAEADGFECTGSVREVELLFNRHQIRPTHFSYGFGNCGVECWKAWSFQCYDAKDATWKSLYDHNGLFPHLHYARDTAGGVHQVHEGVGACTEVHVFRVDFTQGKYSWARNRNFSRFRIRSRNSEQCLHIRSFEIYGQVSRKPT